MALCEQKVCVVENTSGHNQLVSFLDQVPNPELSRNEFRVEFRKLYFIVGPSLPEGLSPCCSTLSHLSVSPTERMQNMNASAYHANQTAAPTYGGG